MQVIDRILSNWDRFIAYTGRNPTKITMSPDVHDKLRAEFEIGGTGQLERVYGMEVVVKPGEQEFEIS